MNFVVLGGGISGLIWTFYNKDYIIITDKVGGQMATDFVLGPRYLHYTENSKRFLEDLKLPAKEIIVKVGYLDDSGWLEKSTDDFRQKYFMKSRNRNNLEGFDFTIMNKNVSEFKALKIDFSFLIQMLADKLSDRIINHRIFGIDLISKKLIMDNNSVHFLNYQKIVSTIPLNIFCELSGIKLNLESHDMTYLLMDKDFFDIKDFDFVYDCRKSTQYHRLTKDKNGIVLDFFGNYHGGYEKYKKRKVIKNSQIISIVKVDKILLEKINVLFFGRYGTWDRSWKTEKVIDETLKYYEGG